MKLLARNFEAVVSCVAFMVMLGIIIANVLMRYFLQISLPYAEEVAYLGFAYCVFFGTVMLYRHHGLIAVTVLVDKLPAQVRHIVLLANFAILIAANLYLLYLGIYLTAGSWVRRTAFLEIPYFYVNLAPTLAFALMAFYSASFFLRAWRRGAEEDVNLMDTTVPEGSSNA